jgi:phosphoribosylamine--glycine ligase
LRILLVGSGGREHALAWSLSASPVCDELIVAPGNAGIAEIARTAPVAAGDVDGLVALAKTEPVDFVVVGPEQPLVLGLVDRLEAAGIAAFGPSLAAARLEGSKAFQPRAFAASVHKSLAPPATTSAPRARPSSSRRTAWRLEKAWWSRRLWTKPKRRRRRA